MAKEKVKKETLEEAFKSVEKEFGKGTIIGGGAMESFSEVISTGSLGLDIATGIGGVPRGKMVELIGWESSGKSTITLNIIANAQKQGITCLLMDGENSFDRKYALALGVDVDKLLVVQIDQEGGEKMYNVAARLISTGEIGLCVFDSQNAMQPKDVLNAESGTSTIGKHSRMLGQTVQKFNMLSGRNNCLILWVSQLREKIGVMFGSPETTQGGNALKFYCQMRLDIRKSVLKEDDVAYANKTKVKIIKNKMAPPFKTAEFEIVFGIGIDKIKEIIDLGSEGEVFKKWGNSITYGEYKFTLEEFVQTLQDNDDFRKEIENKIKNQVVLPVEVGGEELIAVE